MAEPAVERHPGDVIRAVTGVLVLVALAFFATSDQVTRLEADVTRLLVDLPTVFRGTLEAARWLGSLPAVAVVAVLALVFRRPRLARDAVVAGLLAELLAVALDVIVDRGAPADLVAGVVQRATTDIQGFPAPTTAVAAALAAAAGPYLSRTARRWSWVGVALAGVSVVHLGAHLPLDVLGGAALGWAVGAATHLAFGTPSVRPTTDEVTAALAEAGLGQVQVRIPSVDARGSTPFFATTESGEELFVKVVGREQLDADYLFKVFRYLRLRSLEDEAPFATAKRAVEHEAYLSLFAERTGVRTPPMVTVAPTADGGTLLAQRLVRGKGLDAGGPEALADDRLDDLWGQVAILRRHRIAHRDLRLANALLDDRGQAWLIDFGFAEGGASDRRLAQDVAELLASSSLLVGADRSVAAARRVLGDDAVTAAVPLLQPLALSGATRGAMKSHAGLLDEVRTGAACGTEPPPPERLQRVRPRTLAVLAALGLAVHVLLPQVGELGRTTDAIRDANWGWYAIAALASAATYFMAAVGMQGAVARHLPLGRTAQVQLANSFANRLTPGAIGGLGVSERYLERTGLDRGEAVAGVGLNSGAGFVVHIAAMLVFLPIAGSHVGDVHLPDKWELLVAVVVLFTVAGIVLWSPLGRRAKAPIGEAGRGLLGALRSPARAAALFGGSAGTTAFYALALAACVEAFGGHLSVVKVVAVYLGGAAIAGVAPTPGGLGAMEAALVAGLTALGEDPGTAIAAVLGFRLLTFWLPTLPGFFALRSLRREGAV
jgi:undecaprenyl-diphosphatase